MRFVCVHFLTLKFVLVCVMVMVMVIVTVMVKTTVIIKKVMIKRGWGKKKKNIRCHSS